MREKIKDKAKELYVRNGYAGFSFGDVATALDITRANIHYHFGSKQGLLEEIVEDFVADAIQRMQRTWTAPAPSLRDRMQAQVADLRNFYRRFNRRNGDRVFWSPLARLRHDVEFLGDTAFKALERVNRAFGECLSAAIGEAVDRGELRGDTPVKDVACELRAIILSAPPMTLDTGRFDEIELLFAAFARTVHEAYGARHQAVRRTRAAPGRRTSSGSAAQP